MLLLKEHINQSSKVKYFNIDIEMRLRDGILTLVDLAKHIGSIKDTDIEGYNKLLEKDLSIDQVEDKRDKIMLIMVINCLKKI